ncbi:TPA: ead/Ea22-like family protein [Escherichia coli]|nr:ead/Ea22-like family protein [Escherichia coli]HBN0712641.1 ead/Ea22-like family protein [Escherichia coli]HBN0761017.1 ead/Ea22-like family protein [Escherichia coli]HBN0802886.1 ead/Ea22-like family protein [Escherichia coli]
MSKIDYQALREAAEAIKIAATPQKLLAFRIKVTPQVVLALLDEREAKDKVWSAQDNHINQQADRIESLEKKNGELGRALEAAEKCIAELSASHSKLRDTMAGIHNTIRMDGGYTPLAAILNAAKRAYEESASAAGIRIKGE